MAKPPGRHDPLSRGTIASRTDRKAAASLLGAEIPSSLLNRDYSAAKGTFLDSPGVLWLLLALQGSHEAVIICMAWIA